MVKGYYHSIDTFGAVDGQGIRYVLFMAGCSLGCKFCHNPDTWAKGDKLITVDEVICDFERYRPFYKTSGGGITVSGGEPLLQSDFVAALFERCRHEGIHTTVDTSGYCSPDDLQKVVYYADAVLFSLKAANPLKHRRLTHMDNELIITNLRSAAALVPLTLRYVVIPGINDTNEDITELGTIIKSLPRKVSVDLLPYHTLGRHKWDSLGWSYELNGVPDATAREVDHVRTLLTNLNITVI